MLVLTTLAVGLLPALLLSAPNVTGLLGEGGMRGGGRATRRLLSGLVVANVALGVALLSGAGWLVRSYAELANVDPGFQPEGRVVFQALLTGSRYSAVPPLVETPRGLDFDPTWVPPEETPRLWFDQLTERLLSSDRVSAVGAAQTLPLERDWDGGFYAVASPEDFDPDRTETVRRRMVTPGFFEAMGMPLLAGRTFSSSDEFSVADMNTVAVVNEDFVRRVLPGREAIGASFFWGYPSATFGPIQVVGVIADVRYRSLREPAGPAFYLLFYPAQPNVVVRAKDGDALDLIPSIMAATAELDPLIPIEVRRLRDVVDEDLLVYRLAVIISLLFAVVSLVLAAIGTYGVVAQSIAQQSRDLAVRAAVGGSPWSIVSRIVSRGMLFALGGAFTGVWAAYLGGRLVSSRLYAVAPSDPVVLGGAAMSVLVVVFLAHIVPAARARRDNLADSLRVE
jgi:predicted permease